MWGNRDCEHIWEDASYKSRGSNNLPGLSNERYEELRHDTSVFSAFCSLCGAWRGAYGLEPTPEMYVQHTIEILREVKRVLRKDGVVFWNCGDSYMSSGGPTRHWGWADPKNPARGAQDYPEPTAYPPKLIKPKDLCLIPFRVAIAAQEDGWWVRSVIIWSKPNAMPEAVTDRPTESHEYILMLTKSARYYWDADAVREPSVSDQSYLGIRPRNIGALGKVDPSHYAFMGSVGENGKLRFGRTYPTRNIRSVWVSPTAGYPEAHFAVFPEELPKRCIMAATSEKGCCAKCGAPWARITKHQWEHKKQSPKVVSLDVPDSPMYRGGHHQDGLPYSCEVETLGWRPTCSCEAETKPCLVLDPFAGSGTTGAVAKSLGRRAVMYELSAEYCKLAQRRVEAITARSPLL